MHWSLIPRNTNKQDSGRLSTRQNTPCQCSCNYQVWSQHDIEGFVLREIHDTRIQTDRQHWDCTHFKYRCWYLVIGVGQSLSNCRRVTRRWRRQSAASVVWSQKQQHVKTNFSESFTRDDDGEAPTATDSDADRESQLHAASVRLESESCRFGFWN